jgi:hypothetical protein
MISMVYEEFEHGPIKMVDYYDPDPNIYQDYKDFESNPKWGISIKVGEFVPSEAVNSKFFRVQTYFDDDCDLSDDDYRNIAGHPLPLVSIVACILEKCPKKIALLTLLPTPNPYKLLYAREKLRNRWGSSIADQDLIILLERVHAHLPSWRGMLPWCDTRKPLQNPISTPLH